jgi:hypothetical protein
VPIRSKKTRIKKKCKTRVAHVDTVTEEKEKKLSM